MNKRSLLLASVFTCSSALLPAADHNFSLGAFIGTASHGGEALEGYSQTTFDDCSPSGIDLAYRWKAGHSLCLRVSRFSMTMTENENNFGQLNLQPIMLLYRYQTKPTSFSNAQVGYHFDIGGGIVNTSFDKGPFIANLEAQYGNQVVVNITTDQAMAAEFGIGVDLWLSSRFTMSLDYRGLATDVDTHWSAAGPAATVDMPFSKFKTTTNQFVLTARVWF